MNNPLLDGTELYGISLMPESALNDAGSGVLVTGIASTPQARVEIRQQGIMVYSTLVPAGPFTLTDIPLRNVTSDLTVTVIEIDGSQHSGGSRLIVSLRAGACGRISIFIRPGERCI